MTIDLTLRNIKGTALTYTELDNNFKNISSSIADLIATSHSGSFSGSFTGSYSGSLIGSFSGSHSGSFSGSLYAMGYSVFPYLSASLNFSNDATASIAGVPLGGLYHTSGTIKIRLV